MATALIIPTYNQPDLLKKCLLAITQHTADASYRVVIADDNSPDPAMQGYLERLTHEGYTVIKNGSGTRGFPHNCNWAIKETTEPFIALVNQDVEVCPGWLPALRREMDDAQVGVVGALLLYPKAKGYGKPGLVQHAGVARNANGQPFHIYRFADKDDPRVQARRTKINAVTFALALIRRTTWDAVGGLDERYVGGQFEDVSFNWAARDLGWKVVYTPKAMAYHYEHGSGEEFCQATSAANLERFIAHWGRLPSDEYLFSATEALSGQEAVVETLAKELWNVYVDGVGVIGANPTQAVIEAGRKLLRTKWDDLDPARQERLRAWARKVLLAKVESRG